MWFKKNFGLSLVFAFSCFSSMAYSDLVPVRSINCGGAKVGIFEADNSFSGGGTFDKWSFTIKNNPSTNGVPDSVYNTERYGSFSYNISGLTAASPYVVRILFSENTYTVPERSFSVEVNGKVALNDINPFTLANYQMFTAVVKDYATTSDASGNVNLKFSTSPGSTNANAMGIQVLKESVSNSIRSFFNHLQSQKSNAVSAVFSPDHKSVNLKFMGLSKSDIATGNQSAENLGSLEIRILNLQGQVIESQRLSHAQLDENGILRVGFTNASKNGLGMEQVFLLQVHSANINATTLLEAVH